MARGMTWTLLTTISVDTRRPDGFSGVFHSLGEIGTVLTLLRSSACCTTATCESDLPVNYKNHNESSILLAECTSDWLSIHGSFISNRKWIEQDHLTHNHYGCFLS
eukprot:m.120699 g.120699  ORF g.120699 m.120699 type:complete len:106 (+) comp14370_c1_seq7:40-357(+)